MKSARMKFHMNDRFKPLGDQPSHVCINKEGTERDADMYIKMENPNQDIRQRKQLQYKGRHIDCNCNDTEV